MGVIEEHMLQVDVLVLFHHGLLLCKTKSERTRRSGQAHRLQYIRRVSPLFCECHVCRYVCLLVSTFIIMIVVLVSNIYGILYCHNRMDVCFSFTCTGRRTPSIRLNLLDHRQCTVTWRQLQPVVGGLTVVDIRVSD